MLSVVNLLITSPGKLNPQYDPPFNIAVLELPLQFHLLANFTITWSGCEVTFKSENYTCTIYLRASFHTNPCVAPFQ